MNATGIIEFLTIFTLAVFVGFEVISKVPSILHTPLMSGSNAIHGIVLVGALLVMGEAHGPLQLALGFLAVFLASLNVVGGFVVTDRMLEMFRARQPERAPARDGASESSGADQGGAAPPAVEHGGRAAEAAASGADGQDARAPGPVADGAATARGGGSGMSSSRPGGEAAT